MHKRRSGQTPEETNLGVSVVLLYHMQPACKKSFSTYQLSAYVHHFKQFLKQRRLDS